ncbi:MAG: molybdopterin-dependent oxidoreductase, partial [Thermoplasmatota archaeon]
MFDDKELKVLAITAIVLITASMFMGCTEESSDGLVTVEGDDMTLSDLEEMETVSGSSKYQNRMGNWNEEADYEGVPLNELITDMDSNDILKVTASDGYSQKYSYEQVNPTGEKETILGDLILAYSENGDKVPDWEEGPMIAVLPDDGEFSNDDLNVTRSITSEFNRQTSAGSLWVKNIEKIEVQKDVYSDTETALTLEGTTSHDYSIEQIQDMNSYTGEGAFLNSAGNFEGPYEYKGVNVSSLVSNIYSGDDYTLEVEASDGYVMTYSNEQIQGGFKTYDDQGNPTSGEDVTPILAYEEIGEEELHGGPLRLVAVGEDVPITDGHFWAKMVRYIRVKPSQEYWTLELKGLESNTMDKQTFESAATCDHHETTYEDGEDAYGGLPLWILVSAMDGADDPDGHYMFNSELADEGYKVKVIAGDGYSHSFPSEQVARNDSLLVANTLNGEPLPEGDFPLRLVGDDLTSEQMIKNIVKIELTDLPDVSTWSVTLNGT